MIIVYLDESGYARNWERDINTQPFYVLAAVCFPAAQIPALNNDIRDAVEQLNLPGLNAPIGFGAEIKAKDIAKGTGWWGQHNEERNIIRELMLNAPNHYDGTSFVVIINKTRLQAQYVDPIAPHILSLKYMLERLQHYLEDINDYAICVYDHNHLLEEPLRDKTGQLLYHGSYVIFWNGIETVEYYYSIDRIAEFTYASSKYSIGLQIADFFATMTYQYFKDNRPTSCGWWKTLSNSLYKKDGQLDGIGLKIFP